MRIKAEDKLMGAIKVSGTYKGQPGPALNLGSYDFMNLRRETY